MTVGPNFSRRRISDPDTATRNTGILRASDRSCAKRSEENLQVTGGHCRADRNLHAVVGFRGYTQLVVASRSYGSGISSVENQGVHSPCQRRGLRMEQLPWLLRDLFPVTNRYIYMNHASVSPLSTRVAESMKRQIDGTMRGGTTATDEWGRMYDRARDLAAQLIGTRPQQIAFLRNTSDAICSVANGITWKPGDNLVTSRSEFPSNIYPWLRVAEERGVEMRLVEAPDGCVREDAILDRIDDHTRVVALSWVHFVSGHRLNLAPIAERCRRHDALFVVDAIQGLGALALSVERDGVDAVAAGANKFLLGPEGVSLLYLSERALDRVHPTVVGWYSVKKFRDYLDYRLDFRSGARGFEPGTMNTVGLYGLAAAIELFLEVGPPVIERYLLDLRGHLADRLRAAGYTVAGSPSRDKVSAIVACRHPVRSAERLAEGLIRGNTIVSARLGWLRLSPHFYNSFDEADRVVEALTT